MSDYRIVGRIKGKPDVTWNLAGFLYDDELDVDFLSACVKGLREAGWDARLVKATEQVTEIDVP